MLDFLGTGIMTVDLKHAGTLHSMSNLLKISVKTVACKFIYATCPVSMTDKANN